MSMLLLNGIIWLPREWDSHPFACCYLRDCTQKANIIFTCIFQILFLKATNTNSNGMGWWVFNDLIGQERPYRGQTRFNNECMIIFSATGFGARWNFVAKGGKLYFQNMLFMCVTVCNLRRSSLPSISWSSLSLVYQCNFNGLNIGDLLPTTALTVPHRMVPTWRTMYTRTKWELIISQIKVDLRNECHNCAGCNAHVWIREIMNKLSDTRWYLKR